VKEVTEIEVSRNEGKWKTCEKEGQRSVKEDAQRKKKKGKENLNHNRRIKNLGA
jgi:hypothetical protein